MGQVWNELQPKLGCLFGSNNGFKSDFWEPNEEEEKHSWEWGSKTGKTNWATVLYYIVYIPFNKAIFVCFMFNSWKIQQAHFAIPGCSWRNNSNQCIMKDNDIGYTQRIHSSNTLCSASSNMFREVFYTNIIENIWRAVFFSFFSFSLVATFYILWTKMCKSCHRL